jgi:hypothetical protein
LVTPLALACVSAPGRNANADPQRSNEELLAGDRRFSAAAANTDLVEALGNMFAADISMQAPGGHVRGRDAAIAALRANAANVTSRVQWTPVGVGTSSDGQHGFTFGYMTLTRADGSTVPGKYISYWVKHRDGWRVVVYKRVPRPAGEVSLAMLPRSKPTPGLPRGDAATVRRYADELRQAEIAFSNDAKPMGLGPAFFKWGAPDAVNAGGGASAEFVRGPDAISRTVGGGAPQNFEISWAPTDVIVSATGDLGVSIGTIHIVTPPSADKPAETRDVPFFTIWKRATPADPWRYVAE